MFQVQNKTEETSGPRSIARSWLVIKFLALWMGSLIILTAIGLLVDINWTKPRLEAGLGKTLHRKIKLGQLRWHLGLNGLMLLTRSLTINEMDDEPFLKARGTNIGLAFVPLLTGKLIVKHLQIDHPEIFAVKLKAGAWNFEDLFDAKTPVNFMEIDSGTVHITDVSKDAVIKQSFDLNDVNVKFNWPRKGKNSPVFASCSVIEDAPEPVVITPQIKEAAAAKSRDKKTIEKIEKAMANKGTAGSVQTDGGVATNGTVHTDDGVATNGTVQTDGGIATNGTVPTVASAVKAVARAPGYMELEGLTTSKGKNFLDTDYDVKCKLTDMPSASLSKLMAIVLDDPKVKQSFIPNPKIANLRGTLSLNAKIKGNITKGFTADLKADLKDAVLASPSIGVVKTKSLSGLGDISMTSDLIAWKNLDFKLGGMELKTRGGLKNWQSQDSSYAIDMSSKIAELGTVSSALEFSGMGKKEKEEEDKMFRIFKTVSMSGRAFFDIKLTGNRDQAKLLTQLEAEGLPVSRLVDEIAPELAPLFIVSGVGKDAIVKGHFNSNGGRRVSIDNGVITIPDSSIKLDGEVDLLRDSIDIKFDLQDFPLKKAWENALKNETTRKTILNTLTNTNPRNIVVAGFVKATGNIVRNKKGTSVNIVSTVHDGAISYNDNSLDTTKINGTVSFKNDIVSIDGFKGSIGKGGHFDLSGKVFSLFTKPYCSIDFAGTGVNFAHLGTVMNVFHLSFPAITEGHLTGTVKSLIIKITGSHNHPLVYFNAAPDDVSYQPPGLGRSLKANSGNIIYDSDKIILSNVGIISHGNKVITNLTIYDISHKARLSDVHVKSDGIELSDVNYYLSSPVMPASLRKSYKDFLAAYRVRNLHGKIYGDLTVVPKPNDDLADLEGVIGCYSVGATVSKLNLPIERLAGTFAASGPELLIQDLSGYVRSTQFEMNGWVKNYKTNNPSWKTDLRANIAPNEFLDLVPALTETISNGKLKVYSAGPLSLRSKVQGDNKRNEVTFSAHADADDHLRISTPMAVINQPHLQELNLDGSATLDQEALTLHKTNLTLGDASLKAEGLWQWSQPDQPVSMTVASIKPVPAKILLELIDPTFDTKSVSGSVDGNVSLTGPLRHPILKGKVKLAHITTPDLNIFDLSGAISTDDTAQNNPDSGISPSSGRLASVARVDLDKLSLRKLALNNIGGWVQIEAGDEVPGSDLPAPPKLGLRGFTAKTAGGSIKLDGSFDVANRTATFNSYLSGVNTDSLGDKLFNTPGELSGTMDGEIHLTSSGENYKQILNNLEGTGAVVVKDGVVARFGQLQTKITQANLLEQGILGFNFNNLLQSMVPVRTGVFKQLTSKFSIFKGVLAIKELRYSGDDLRMWGAGVVNLPGDKMDVEVAGNIPRVTQSMLGGELGNLSRRITLAKILNRITLGAFENLPALPLIGEIASDKPRTFSFKVDAAANDAKQITRTIEKSFKWLPNKQAATAHPVPGI